MLIGFTTMCTDFVPLLPSAYVERRLDIQWRVTESKNHRPGREIIFALFLSYLPNQVTAAPRGLSFKLMGGLEEEVMDTWFPTGCLLSFRNSQALAHTLPLGAVHLMLTLEDKNIVVSLSGQEYSERRRLLEKPDGKVRERRMCISAIWDNKCMSSDSGDLKHTLWRCWLEVVRNEGTQAGPWLA